jgi:hypothetical protein
LITTAPPSSEASVQNSQERATSRAHIAFAFSGSRVSAAEVKEARQALPWEKSLPQPSLLFSFVQEGGGDARKDRAQAELGRLLAAAAGYRVLASDGTHLGSLDHVRYERHADHPDEVVVRSRRLLARRRRVFPFSAVAEVRRGERTVVLRGTRSE